PLRIICRNRVPVCRGSFLFGRIVNSASRWSRLVAGGRPSAPKQMHREADRDRHFAVAAPLARRSICDDRTEPIWWHIGDAPAFYRFKLGTIEATVVSDGPLSIGDPKNTFRGPTAEELSKNDERSVPADQQRRAGPERPRDQYR